MIYTCPECGSSVSDKAEKCPNCGCPIKFVVNPDAKDGIALPKISAKRILHEIVCPFKYYWQMIDNYKDSGRTTRKAYWEAYLLNIVAWPFILGLTGFLTVYLKSNRDFSSSSSLDANYIFRMLVLLIPLFVLYSLFKAAVRRLHDTGRSGDSMFLLILPVIGWIYLAYLHCLPSEKKDNEYGPYKSSE